MMSALIGIVLVVLQTAVLLLAAPLVVAVIKRVKARLQCRVGVAVFGNQRFHRCEKLVRVGKLMQCEAGVVMLAKTIKYAHLTHREHGRQHGRLLNNACHPPARRGVALHCRRQQPRHRADRQQRMRAGREARALVQ